jgi:hypothetical protein
MTTWRDVKWEYDDSIKYVIARVDDDDIIVCYVPPSSTRDSIGRAIAHAWNIDLAAAQSWRELYGIDRED